MMSTEQDLVTALVVGQSLTIEMGVPLAQPKPDGLRLQGNNWEPTGAARSLWQRMSGRKRSGVPLKGNNVIKLAQSQDDPAGAIGVVESRTAHTVGVKALTPWWRRPPVAWAACALLAVLASSVVYLAKSQSRRADALPIAAAPNASVSPQAVTVIAAPYEAAGPILPLASASPAMAAAAVPSGPVPAAVIAQAAGPAPSTPVVNPSAGAAAAAPRSKDKPSTDEKPKPSAVLVDDGPTTQKSTPTQQLVAPLTPARSASAASSAGPPAAAVSKPVAPVLPKSSGLVTITPDGKLAVFSNPKTRMPESFKVGDQLPNGETVRSIDGKEGKVYTNAKEYGLE